MAHKVTIPTLNEMKRAGEKIVGVVVWDTHMAAIAERAGVDIISVGDSVGINLWGQDDPLAVTLEQMITVAQAARAGTERALLSCDLPHGPLQQGVNATLAAAARVIVQTGVDMIKLDGAAQCPEAVTALTRAGIPVWAQFGVTPELALRYGIAYRAQSEPGAELPAELQARLIAEAESLEAAGAALLDFKNSGPIAGAAVAAAVSIPVIGGFGGGPWLDGRVRMAHAAIGYGARHLDDDVDTYASVAKIAYDAIVELSDDIRAARQIKGATSANA